MDISAVKIGFIGFGSMAGGTTIVGISTLEECGFRHAVIHAIDKIMEK